MRNLNAAERRAADRRAATLIALVQEAARESAQALGVDPNRAGTGRLAKALSADANQTSSSKRDQLASPSMSGYPGINVNDKPAASPAIVISPATTNRTL